MPIKPSVQQGQARVGLVHGALELTCTDGRTVFLCDGIGGCFAPVLVDAVLQLDDGEVADLKGQRLVEKRSKRATALVKRGRDPISSPSYPHNQSPQYAPN